MNVDAEPHTGRIRDLPYGWWITGAFSLIIGIALSLSNPLMTLASCIGVILIIIGLLMVSLLPALTISLDRGCRTLRVECRSLLKSDIKEFRLKHIASIDAEESDDGGAYRLVITEHDGTVTPLRSHYGSWNQQLQRRLWELTGISGETGVSRNLKDSISMLTGQHDMVNLEMRQRQEQMSAPGEAALDSADIVWEVQSTGMGRVPLTRWFSPDFQMQGAFLFVVQKSPSSSLINRLLTRGMIARKGALASMAMHGFSDSDAPGKSHARLLDIAALQSHFVVVSSDESAARRILNSSVIRSLNRWAARHPINGIRRLPNDYRMTDSRELGQLAVFCGPRGIYAATVGTLASEPLNELGTIGLDLIRAQDA